MDPATALKLASAAQTLTKAVGMVSDANSYAKTGAISLPEALKKSSIMAKIMVTESLEKHQIMIPLLTTINRLYTCYAVAALGLNSYIGDMKQTVGDLMNTVSTEDTLMDLTADDTLGFLQSHNDSLITNYNMSISELTTLNEYVNGNEAVRTIEVDPKHSTLITGRVVELELSVGKANAKVYLFIQLYPVIVPDMVTESFLGGHFEIDQNYRKMLLKAGEISWVRDFWLQQDLTKRTAKAMALDETGILEELHKMNTSQLRRKIQKNGSITRNRSRNENIANSVFVITQDQLSEFELTFNKNFTREADRQEFFNKTLMMLLVVVDTRHPTVTFYYNSIGMATTTDFKGIEKSAQEKGGYDLKDLVSIMTQDKAPRF